MAYDKEKTFGSILSFIEECNSLRSALRRENMPSSTTFLEWIKEDSEKAVQYARAMEVRSDVIFEQILTIADSNEKDILGVDDNGKEIVNNDVIQRNRLQIDARKWMLGKMQPKKYGEKLDLTSGGDKIQNNTSAIKVRIIENNDDEQ